MCAYVCMHSVYVYMLTQQKLLVDSNYVLNIFDYGRFYAHKKALFIDFDSLTMKF